MQATAPRPGALSHLRVLDLSRVFAGPWAGQMLADLGAEVIKVERPGEGDDARRLGPPFLRDDAGEPTRDAGFFLSANRNKRSVTVDIARPEGHARRCEDWHGHRDGGRPGVHGIGRAACEGCH